MRGSLYTTVLMLAMLVQGSIGIVFAGVFTVLRLANKV